MTVEIPLQFQQFVHNVVGRGTYKTEADVVESALALLQQHEQRIESLRGEILPALERLDRGEGLDLDDDGLDAFFEGVKVQGRAQPLSEQKSQ